MQEQGNRPTPYLVDLIPNNPGGFSTVHSRVPAKGSVARLVPERGQEENDRRVTR